MQITSLEKAEEVFQLRWKKKRSSVDEMERCQTPIPKRHEMLIENTIGKQRHCYEESAKECHRLWEVYGQFNQMGISDF